MTVFIVALIVSTWFLQEITHVEQLGEGIQVKRSLFLQLYFSKTRPTLKGGLVGINKELIGGFNPSEKYARQIGSFPQIGMKITNNLVI